MEIMVNLNGQKRKVLVDAIGKILGEKPEYKGPPTYEYHIGPITVSRDGTILFDSSQTKEALTPNRFLNALHTFGFSPVINTKSAESSNEESPQASIPADSPSEPVKEFPMGFTIQMPIAGFDAASLQNFRLLVQSKASLIKKALGLSDLPVEVTDTTIDFPWFTAEPPPAELSACTKLIAAMCDMAKRQKRVLAVEKPTDNDKFVFRLFLVRLGLIGDENADTRRILLQNLTGNGSWKDGAAKRPPKPREPVATVSAPVNEKNSVDEPAHTNKKKSRFSWRNLFNHLKMMGY